MGKILKYTAMLLGQMSEKWCKNSTKNSIKTAFSKFWTNLSCEEEIKFFLEEPTRDDVITAVVY